MKVIDETILSIKSAKHPGGYKLELNFKNGVRRVVDFSEFLERSKNPLIRRYLDSNEFMSFEVEHGNLHWNDYDLCFPVSDLYEGKL
jgi:hypothetical protein